MATWIALLRGVNVGGRQRVPMRDLVARLADDGLTDVRSYLQSGNLVLRTAGGGARDLGSRVRAVVRAGYGFEPRVLVLGVPELARAINANPFPAAVDDAKAVHLYFLGETPKAPDLAALERLRAGREAFALAGKVFYLHAPDGFADSKLAARAERFLGVDATARNWRTATTLLALARERAPS